jgi:prepilin-type N-terminal cleavage/methylation domain-containing protein
MGFATRSIFLSAHIRARKGAAIVRRAFTLLELVIVIVIIAIIAAIAIPRASNASQRSRFNATWSTFNAIERAAEYYRADNDALPPDYTNGSSHALFRPYMDIGIFQEPTPIGGQWDWNNSYKASGVAVPDWAVVGPNVSICLVSPPLTVWTEFDAAVDNGSLSSGTLRRHNSRFLLMNVAPN